MRIGKMIGKFVSLRVKFTGIDSATDHARRDGLRPGARGSATVVIAALCCGGKLLSATILDSFVDAQAVQKLSPGPDRVEAPPIALTGSIFDYREMSVRGGVQVLSVTGTGVEYQISPPPEGQTSNAFNAFTISYTADQPVNLLGNGADKFVIDFLSLQSQLPYNFTLNVKSEGVLRRYVFSELLDNLDVPASISIPFSVFSDLNLRSVDEVVILGDRMPIGTSLSITGISIVPEPSHALLMSMAAVACLSRRVRERAPAFAGRKEGRDD